MSTSTASLPSLPADTAYAAKALLAEGDFYQVIGDRFDLLVAEIDMSNLYTAEDIPAVHPAVLTLVTLFQFLEDLLDQQAADAARTWTDWKYALHLPLNHPGFDPKLLWEFRERLVPLEARQPILGCVLANFRELGLLENIDPQPPDGVFILDAVGAHNRLKQIMETMRVAMETLATWWPEWLQKIALPHWYERYSLASPSFRFLRDKEERDAQALAIGADGFYLLNALTQPDAPELAVAMAEIKSVRQVWNHHFEKYQGQVRWRAARDALLPADAESSR